MLLSLPKFVDFVFNILFRCEVVSESLDCHARGSLVSSVGSGTVRVSKISLVPPRM